METLPQASGRTSLPGTVSLCVDFAMRCQGSGACWAGWQGVGTADKNPHRIPATSSSQQGALSPREGGAAGRALRVAGRPCTPRAGSLPGNSLLASLVLCWGSCHLRITRAGVLGTRQNRAHRRPSWQGVGRSCGLTKSPRQFGRAVHSENHPLGENEVY